MELRTIRDIWLREAQALPVGRSKRIRNPANPSARASLVVRNEVDKYSAWDYRYNSRDCVYKRTVYDTAEVMASNGADLPTNLRPLTELPTYLQDTLVKFLLKKGVTPQMFGKNDLTYSAKSGRLVVKVEALDGTFYLGRDLTGRSNAKWIRYKGGERKTHAIMYGSGSGVVLTEDYFSAVKINYATGLTAVALLGTMLRNEVALMCTEYPEVIVWLDGDEAGIRGSHKACKDLRALVGRVAEVNIYGYDPKDLTIKEIKSTIDAITTEV